MLVHSSKLMRKGVLLLCYLCFELVRSGESPFHRTVKRTCKLQTSATNKSDQDFLAVQQDGDTVIIVKGTNVDVDEKCAIVRAKRNDTENCEELCGAHGHCSLREAGTPIEHYECICDYGYRGMHCEEKIRTKFALMYVVWVLVAIEILFIIVAVKRYAQRQFFMSPLPHRRFVDVMLSRSKESKKQK
ncbi:unnamed protein product [Cylicocyclus nassatus]|uniref:EGF-like domain-containing protein n=1 Tax=Cylicocyclus nassatus TaxID=53992 RepID=A0AA36DRA0_CYLNA|nr:unnamed protein product [Cylicocyclus nassatus]